jgi:two-component system chemotaxis response regulator CheY
MLTRADVLVIAAVPIDPILPRWFIMAEVLVVDDSKVMREMLVACLRGKDELSFTQASSGLEAIEQLSLRPFDLLLLDLNMPDIGGIEVVEFVRSQDRLCKVPIIIITTRGDDESRERALKAGATRFMTKPFSPETIQSEVTTILSSAEARG